MDLSEWIHKWLTENGSFLEGVRLYKLTINPIYAIKFERLLDRKYVDEDAKAHLSRLLKSYLSTHPPINNRPLKTPSIPIEEDEVETEEEPASVKALRLKAIPLHKRYSHLKAQLYQMSIDTQLYFDKDRYNIAFEIMEEILPETDSIYDQIRRWDQAGELPPEPENILVQQTVEKMQKIYSLRPRISRLKSWVEKKGITAAEKRKYEKELLDKEIELSVLEVELGLKA